MPLTLDDALKGYVRNRTSAEMLHQKRQEPFLALGILVKEKIKG